MKLRLEWFFTLGFGADVDNPMLAVMWVVMMWVVVMWVVVMWGWRCGWWYGWWWCAWWCGWWWCGGLAVVLSMASPGIVLSLTLARSSRVSWTHTCWWRWYWLWWWCCSWWWWWWWCYDDYIASDISKLVGHTHMLVIDRLHNRKRWESDKTKWQNNSIFDPPLTKTTKNDQNRWL